jgi:hypothetical protein
MNTAPPASCHATGLHLIDQRVEHDGWPADLIA